MMGEGADADLHQPLRMTRLADARKGRGVAARIAGEIIVEIGMRVEVEDRHRAVTRGRGLDERAGDRMVAAAGERNVPILAHIGDLTADRRVVRRRETGSASCGERVWPYGSTWVVAVGIKNK